MDSNTEIQRLLALYTKDQIRESELLRLKTLLDDPAGRVIAANEVEALFSKYQGVTNEDYDVELMFEQVMQRSRDESNVPAIAVHRVHFLKTAWFRYVAVATVIIGMSVYLWMEQKNRVPPASIATNTTTSDILPGSDGAILTLSDGRTLVLDSGLNGVVATQGGARLSLADGQLSYDRLQGAMESNAQNTVSTPIGKQFRLSLPDGTLVWLNAASSLTYPPNFTGKERNVKVTGEAYFEVAQNKAMPFRISCDHGITVDVLGTAFNIRSYGDNGIMEATLVNGSVRIHTDSIEKELKPRQHVLVASDAGITVRNLNEQALDGELAWKNKLFNFQGKSLKEVMGQLSRWYDVEVVYEKSLPEIRFFGEMSRELTLSAVLRALQENGLHCRLEPQEKRLVVLP